MNGQRLRQLFEEQGQSPWIDNLKRSLITSGGLRSLIDDGVRGLTSNPTIFQKAIQDSLDYDQQYFELRRQGLSTIDTYWALVRQDIRDAADCFADLYRQSRGGDGYVSVEVDPSLAHDGPGTLAAARHLWSDFDRPNLMVKVPATVESLPIIQTLIAEGCNVNVTLIFSLDRYQQVMQAYIAGLSDRLEAGHELSHVASVASFFISRVDSEVDARLESIGTETARTLSGQAAIAQGCLAYELFQQTFSGTRWDRIAAAGGKVQRPLWASTSTKNPSYPDTLYVDSLIGPQSVNTLPDATVASFADHGTVSRTVDSNLTTMHRVWSDLAQVGIDMDEVSRKLEKEGLASFTASFVDLLAALDSKV
jgi:transaldolase